jgi:multidrug efflux pump subunit AcrA (membrane-fusion protein)
MYAQANLTLDRRSRVLTIPILAVDLAGNDASGRVVVVTPENTIEIRKVELGIQTDSKVEVRSGLQEGDLVVTSNRSSLRQGQQVRPKLTDIAASAAS